MEALRKDEPNAHPFNSVLETGIRALVLLEAVYPRECDLMEMTWLDHLVVHTSDLADDDAPESLHPDVPNRVGELLVRRQLIERSIRMMQQMHLIDSVDRHDGISYVAGEDATSIVSMLQSAYSLELRKRAGWMAERLHGLSSSQIKGLVEEKIGRWTAEFRLEHSTSGSQ